MLTLIAHRGASKEAPENTLIAMRTALDIGVDYIECDVHLSRDEVPVIIHDAILGRTTYTRPLERITDLDLNQIRELDVGRWFGKIFAKQRIPTLDEVLQLDRGNTGLMIEIKKGRSPLKPCVNSVLNALANARKERVILGSFSLQVLEEIRHAAPEQALIGIVEDFNKLDELRVMHLSHVAVWYKLLTPQIVENLHEEGAQVWAFTVDEPRTVQFLKFIGVDGIITNDPRQMRQLLK